MIKTFITSFKLKNTYKANSLIYSLKSLPIIKEILPYSLYKSKVLKIIANIISILIEIGSTFFGKFLYMLLMISIMVSLYNTEPSNTFLHIFTFLTIIGGVINAFMFKSTEDKYYAIVTMNMNAKKYALSEYYYSILNIIVGFMPFTIIYGLIYQVPLWICIIMPIFVVMVKTIVIRQDIRHFEKIGKVSNEKLPAEVLLILVVGLLAISYGLPFIGITINQNIFIDVFSITFILGIASLIKIIKFQGYQKMYKKLLTIDNVYAIENQTDTKTIKEGVSKQIEYGDKITSDKKGFAYLHDLFVKRHRKILTKAVKKQTIIILIIFALVIIVSLLNPEMKKDINSIPLTYLPYFVFVMYILNRGTTVTQAMFINCDHSMLIYRIYRTPKVILGLFKQRLKTLTTINLLPAAVIGIGLALLLYITGGTDNILNYFVLFISIIAMSIFFSIHYLVIYYLLQPYNINTEIKNSTYQVIQTLTYIVCYFMTEFKLPTIYFGLATIIFSVLYCLIALILVYKLAPKTFKLRV